MLSRKTTSAIAKREMKKSVILLWIFTAEEVACGECCDEEQYCYEYHHCILSLYLLGAKVQVFAD